MQLYVKAGSDGESYGACPTCQRIFMILLVKARGGAELNFVVNAVNIAKPPEDFRRMAGRLPALVHGDLILTDADDMEKYIEASWPDPKMQFSNQTAVDACLGFFSKFSYYVKEVAQSPAALQQELKKISDYLIEEETVYLCGPDVSLLDCLVLPKLQHVRVIAKAFKDFDIPPEFSGLWRYFAAAYSNEAFKEACPADQEIVAAWESKPDMHPLPREVRRHYAKDGPHAYSFDVPSSN